MSAIQLSNDMKWVIGLIAIFIPLLSLIAYGIYETEQTIHEEKILVTAMGCGELRDFILDKAATFNTVDNLAKHRYTWMCEK